MTEQDGKFLTEWLGECWHERGELMGDSYHIPLYQRCLKCKKKIFEEGTNLSIDNRTFTTATDVQALVDRLKEKELLKSFIRYLPDDGICGSKLFAFLSIENDDQCQLIADFLKSLEVE